MWVILDAQAPDTPGTPKIYITSDVGVSRVDLYKVAPPSSRRGSWCNVASALCVPPPSDEFSSLCTVDTCRGFFRSFFFFQARVLNNGWSEGRDFYVSDVASAHLTEYNTYLERWSRKMSWITCNWRPRRSRGTVIITWTEAFLFTYHGVYTMFLFEGSGKCHFRTEKAVFMPHEACVWNWINQRSTQRLIRKIRA